MTPYDIQRHQRLREVEADAKRVSGFDPDNKVCTRCGVKRTVLLMRLHDGGWVCAAGCRETRQ